MTFKEFRKKNLPLIDAKLPLRPDLQQIKCAEDLWNKCNEIGISKVGELFVPYFLDAGKTDVKYADGAYTLVYDILNVGDKHRYVANGKLVHNSDKVNLQNLSKRTKDPVLRRSLRAPRGSIWVAADSGQIENRLACFVAGQQDVMDVFLSGKDVYIDMATKIYNEPYEVIWEQSKGNPTKEGKLKRNIAKAVVLGAGYGASAAKFAELMQQQGLAEQAGMAEELITTFRTSNNRISGFWHECDRVLDILYAGGSCWFGGGR